MKKHSYKEIERQRREEDILHVAERLLLERGYGNLNMDELADAVGISKPTLYQHALGGYQGKTGVMPAKGGRTDLPDDIVKQGVDYLVSLAQ